MAMRYEKEPITIRDFLLKWYPNIDVQPVGQRLNTTNTLVGKSYPSKAQGIIRTIVEGIENSPKAFIDLLKELILARLL